jgi:hypothetical protein
VGEHVAHLIAPLQCLDVPGEGDEVASVALSGEHLGRRVAIAGRQRGVEFGENRLKARIRRRVEHYVLPMISSSMRRVICSLIGKLREFSLACKSKTSVFISGRLR